MKNTAATAEEIYLIGASYSEAVWRVYVDQVGLSPAETALGNRLAIGFSGGAGVGDLCGALAGAILALGHKFGRQPGEQRNPQLEIYCRQLCQQARQQLGSLYCRNLRVSKEKGKCGFAVREITKIFDELIAVSMQEQQDCQSLLSFRKNPNG